MLNFTNSTKAIYKIKLIFVGGDSSLVFFSWVEVKNKLIGKSLPRSIQLGDELSDC